ncbi:MAG: octaprenyl diphosphate synthase, partial [Deltaproteobacteria bacterium RBG_13_52_11b]
SIRDDLEKVDQEFQKNLGSSVPIISEIGEYLRLSGGKRFRAKLLLLSAKLCGYHGDFHISMAGLIEFIHTATLLHDDVVDKAELRRGSASANSIWGNEACVLVGDFLFTKCFSLMVESGNWDILKTISNATMLMAEGELEELVNTRNILLSEENYLSIIARKTAILISAATKIGAILSNVSEEKKKALFSFGTDVGIAFQLIDDNLDYTSKQEEFGKKIGIDLQDGKITLPLIFTLSRCTPEQRAFIQKIVESDPITEEAFFDVVNIIERYEGIQYTQRRAKEYIERAKRHLDLFPKDREQEALYAMADYILERRL